MCAWRTAFSTPPHSQPQSLLGEYRVAAIPGRTSVSPQVAPPFSPRSHLRFPPGRTSLFPQVAPPFPPRSHLPFPPGRTSSSPQVAPPFSPGRTSVSPQVAPPFSPRSHLLLQSPPVPHPHLPIPPKQSLSSFYLLPSFSPFFPSCLPRLPPISPLHALIPIPPSPHFNFIFPISPLLSLGFPPPPFSHPRLQPRDRYGTASCTFDEVREMRPFTCQRLSSSLRTSSSPPSSSGCSRAVGRHGGEDMG
ncbi:unnamed protein product [Closterium sp. Naga37s-1]|nr:unnamed protein product [Closterium sp. Naga37s-1]